MAVAKPAVVHCHPRRGVRRTPTSAATTTLTTTLTPASVRNPQTNSRSGWTEAYEKKPPSPASGNSSDTVMVATAVITATANRSPIWTSRRVDEVAPDAGGEAWEAIGLSLWARFAAAELIVHGRSAPRRPHRRETHTRPPHPPRMDRWPGRAVRAVARTRRGWPSAVTAARRWPLRRLRLHLRHPTNARRP